LSAASARTIHEDLTHDARGDGDKMAVVLPWCATAIGQADVRLVHERRRLKGLAGALTAQQTGRCASQFVVHGDREI
jgi:hypothetical protein